MGQLLHRLLSGVSTLKCMKHSCFLNGTNVNFFFFFSLSFSFFFLFNVALFRGRRGDKKTRVSGRDEV